MRSEFAMRIFDSGQSVISWSGCRRENVKAVYLVDQSIMGRGELANCDLCYLVPLIVINTLVIAYELILG